MARITYPLTRMLEIVNWRKIGELSSPAHTNVYPKITSTESSGRAFGCHRVFHTLIAGWSIFLSSASGVPGIRWLDIRDVTSP